MFQSGHRRYGQRFGDGDYPIEENTEEDNWRFVERSMAMEPMKPVIDGEPIYEEIPHGLHDENELLWKDYDVRRYAYWSVFAGAFGHTYGHNSIMQFIKPGVGGAYGAKKPLSLIHISEPTRLGMISYAVFCLKKKKKKKKRKDVGSITGDNQ